MRRFLLAAAAVSMCVFSAGCQDYEARNQNARLQAELDALKAQKPAGGDDMTKLLLALKGDDSVNKQLVSLSGDVNTGLKDIKSEMRLSADEQKRRTEDLEKKMGKVEDLERSVLTLKSLIETLDTKVKNVDPNQVLDAQKQLLQAQADLRLEQEARKAADARAQKADDDRAAAIAQMQRMLSEEAEWKSGSIKKHPDYVGLKKQLDDEIKARKQLESDYRNLEAQLKDVLERKGTGSPDGTGAGRTGETPRTTAEPDFTGRIKSVGGARKPGEASLLLVDIVSGEVPPTGAEVVIVDANGETICRGNVTMRWNDKSKDEPPYVQVGVRTVDEKRTRPAAVGDKVVWIKPRPDGSAGGK